MPMARGVSSSACISELFGIAFGRNLAPVVDAIAKIGFVYVSYGSGGRDDVDPDRTCCLQQTEKREKRCLREE